jgi:hypothetical protein
MKPIYYISDCNDDNVKARYGARIQSCIKNAGTITFVGVESDLEASGNLVDVLDGLGGLEAIIFVNVAPRGTMKTKWPNGTPFGYLQYNNAHIFTTIDGYMLSLLQKIHGAPLTVAMYDIPSVVPYLTNDAALQEYIVKSQFRSFDFLPRVAGYVLSGENVPTTPFTDTPQAPSAVWWIDNFGNAKTTITSSEANFTEQEVVKVEVNKTIQELPFYERLKDIPFGETAIYIGSSGFGTTRFLEITKQKGDELATHHHSTVLELSAGTPLRLI